MSKLVIDFGKIEGWPEKPKDTSKEWHDGFHDATTEAEQALQALVDESEQATRVRDGEALFYVTIPVKEVEQMTERNEPEWPDDFQVYDPDNLVDKLQFSVGKTMREACIAAFNEWQAEQAQGEVESEGEG